jgi:hypothetical protein
MPSFRTLRQWLSPQKSIESGEHSEQRTNSQPPDLQDSRSPHSYPLSGRARLGSVVDASTSTFRLLLVRPFPVLELIPIVQTSDSNLFVRRLCKNPFISPS